MNLVYIQEQKVQSSTARAEKFPISKQSSTRFSRIKFSCPASQTTRRASSSNKIQRGEDQSSAKSEEKSLFLAVHGLFRRVDAMAAAKQTLYTSVHIDL